jgi:hypothetical protein
MLRPIRLLAVIACAAAIVATTTASASAGTADIAIAGCTMRANTTGGPPPAAVTVLASGATASCGALTARLNANVNLTFDAVTGAVTADLIDVTGTGLIFFSCRYQAANVTLAQTAAGPPTWTYDGTATARKISGNYADCRDEVTGPATLTLTP